MRMNWTEVLNDEVAKSVYIGLAQGTTDRKTAEIIFAYTPHAGPFRSLVRNGGVQRARTIARKALLRRGLVKA